MGNWPIAPNSVNAGTLASFPIMPDSLPTLLETSVTGAPVSKIIRYGPLPLILTLMARCFVLSTSMGTVTGLSATGFSIFFSARGFFSSAWSATAGQQASRIVAPNKTAMRFMSQPLSYLHGHFARFAAALDADLDRFTWRQSGP